MAQKCYIVSKRHQNILIQKGMGRFLALVLLPTLPPKRVLEAKPFWAGGWVWEEGEPLKGWGGVKRALALPLKGGGREKI
jgi:hypothetical protein